MNLYLEIYKKYLAGVQHMNGINFCDCEGNKLGAGHISAKFWGITGAYCSKLFLHTNYKFVKLLQGIKCKKFAYVYIKFKKFCKTEAFWSLSLEDKPLLYLQPFFYLVQKSKTFCELKTLVKFFKVLIVRCFLRIMLYESQSSFLPPIQAFRTSSPSFSII